jgi:predicted dehydrogenase
MSEVRIGFIGGGTIANHHARAIDELDGSITAMADVDPDARRAFATEYGVDETYGDYRTMLRDADLDAAVVAVPNALHADCTIAALEADVDVLVEKPLATSYDEATNIAAAERESEGTVMVGFSQAFNAWAAGLEERVSDGQFGDVYELDVEYVRRRGIPQLGSWFTRREVAGGGAMIDIGVHVLHLALRLLDFPDIRDVSATTGSYFGTKDDYTYLNMWGGDPVENATFDVDDHTRALIHAESGQSIHLHVAWASNTDPRQQLRIYGDEAGATVRTDGADVETTVRSTDGDALSTTELEYSSADPFVEEWCYFLEVVEGERDHTRNTLSEGLAVQEIIDAIYESADRRTETALARQN